VGNTLARGRKKLLGWDPHERGKEKKKLERKPPKIKARMQNFCPGETERRKKGSTSKKKRGKVGEEELKPIPEKAVSREKVAESLGEGKKRSG